MAMVPLTWFRAGIGKDNSSARESQNAVSAGL